MASKINKKVNKAEGSFDFSVESLSKSAIARIMKMQTPITRTRKSRYVKTEYSELIYPKRWPLFFKNVIELSEGVKGSSKISSIGQK